MAELLELGGARVLCCAADGPPIDGDRGAADLVGEALSVGATLIAVPVGRLPPDFFRLRSGLAGLIAQKVVNYRLKLAVIGDITAYLAASGALRDWVRECDRGGEIWFLPHLDDLKARLAAPGTPR